MIWSFKPPWNFNSGRTKIVAKEHKNIETLHLVYLWQILDHWDDWFDDGSVKSKIVSNLAASRALPFTVLLTQPYSIIPHAVFNFPMHSVLLEELRGNFSLVLIDLS